MSIESSTVGGRTKVKIVLLGDQSVGKSAIIEKFVNDKFTQIGCSTVGIDFLVKNIVYKDRGFRLQLWDTAGQERFRSLIPSYLKDAICCIVVFDVTRKETLANAAAWLKLYKQSKGQPRRALLVGNKIDLNVRTVTRAEGQSVAKQLKLPYIQVSAKTGKKLQDLFNLSVELSVFSQQVEMEAVQEADQKAQKRGDQSTSGVSKQNTNTAIQGKTVSVQKSFAINNPPQVAPVQSTRGCNC